MPTRWAGASGRYQAICEQGHCALTGGEATSKREGQIFALLSYVIGPGQHDLRIRIGSRVVRVDMAFSLLFRRVLAVEYDGAYWHQGREERDSRKTHMIQCSGQYLVVRIREDPLSPLTPLDVRVPPRAEAAECVRLTLLHLVHDLSADLDQDALWRIGHFLNASAQPLESSRIACRICGQVARDAIDFHPPFTDRPTRGFTRSPHRRPDGRSADSPDLHEAASSTIPGRPTGHRSGNSRERTPGDERPMTSREEPVILAGEAIDQHAAP